MAGTETYVSGGGSYSYNQWASVGVGNAGTGCDSIWAYNFTIDPRTNYLLAYGSSESGTWSSMTHDFGGLGAAYTQHVNGGYNTDIWGYASPVRGDTVQERSGGSSFGCWLGGGAQFSGVDVSNPVVDTSTDITASDTLVSTPGGLALGLQGSRLSGGNPTNLTELWDRTCWTSSPCGVGRGVSVGWATTPAKTITIGYSIPGLSGASSGITLRGVGGGNQVMLIASKMTRSMSLLQELSDKYKRLIEEMLLDPMVAWFNPQAFPKDYEHRNRHWDELELLWQRGLWEWEISR